ncbi:MULTISPECIES: SGNH/GDSL hydrolase family protein [Arthrobacter]|uniref:SGNH/GDSL hydrolase family protein n=1 Tax=Arthrobacter terricola TaxID=2547396 RepID=A0A4R5KMJ5_9MICC|nr:MULTISPECIES: SGNH/GDSL hydrolase family protein [Arthrobacter]MBT8160980.1 SGNH/GDSL hydrolase family protein [Arthrobacter sp. GN70]TDF96843.1 SGNH/GDSL hydrolase family protein [Arthrobacter terricola]
MPIFHGRHLRGTIRRHKSAALIIAGAVLAAGALTGGGILVKKQLDNDKGCESVTNWVESRGDFVKIGTGAEKVAILGDSYAAGDLLTDRTKGWVYDLAQAKGWSEYVDGVGYTGYTNGGFCGDQQYGTRIANIRQLAPDTLIIEGGLNDAGKSREEVQSAADGLLRKFSAVKNVIVLGPVNAPARSGLTDIDAALSAAAATNNRQYISALSWSFDYLPDRLHLTEASHAKFADLVAAQIR